MGGACPRAKNVVMACCQLESGELLSSTMPLVMICIRLGAILQYNGSHALIHWPHVVQCHVVHITDDLCFFEKGGWRICIGPGYLGRMALLECLMFLAKCANLRFPR